VTAIHVLDASALIAVIFREAGSDVVEPVLKRAAMSAVNLSEVAAKLIDRGYTIADAQASVQAFQLDVRPFDNGQALAAASLRATTRSRGLSLGDRACLALAESLNATVLTADRAWATYDRVDLIR